VYPNVTTSWTTHNATEELRAINADHGLWVQVLATGPDVMLGQIYFMNSNQLTITEGRQLQALN